MNDRRFKKTAKDNAGGILLNLKTLITTHMTLKNANNLIGHKYIYLEHL